MPSSKLTPVSDGSSSCLCSGFQEIAVTACSKPLPSSCSIGVKAACTRVAGAGSLCGFTLARQCPATLATSGNGNPDSSSSADAAWAVFLACR